jgi:hypothetical protein
MSKFRGACALFICNTIQESQHHLGKKSSEFFSAGLRAGIYGPASSNENMKIGIELRDSTRNLDLLGQYSELISKSIESRIWENGDIKKNENQSLRLTTDRSTATNVLNKIISSEYAKLFVQIDPTVYFGLIHFEEIKIFDYKINAFVSISSEAVARIKYARSEYENELRILEQELKKIGKIKNDDYEVVKKALRINLQTWAQMA